MYLPARLNKGYFGSDCSLAREDRHVSILASITRQLSPVPLFAILSFFSALFLTPNAIHDSLPVAFIPTNKRLETVFSHLILVKHRLLVAYLLGYTTTTTPRIASICARYIAKRLKQRSVESPKNEDSISSERELGRRLLAAVKGGIRFDGFAMVCGITLLSS